MIIVLDICRAIIYWEVFTRNYYLPTVSKMYSDNLVSTRYNKIKYIKLDYKMMSVQHCIFACWDKLKVSWVKLNSFFLNAFLVGYTVTMSETCGSLEFTPGTPLWFYEISRRREHEGGRCKVPNHPPFEAEPHPPLHFLLSPPHQK